MKQLIKNLDQYSPLPLQLNGVRDKLVITDGNDHYLLKFGMLTAQGESKDYLTEYMASEMGAMLGYEVHQVALGHYHGRPCAVIRMFPQIPVSFNGLGTSTVSGRKLTLKGRYDRHEGNWGFIKNTTGKYVIAPLYDNGSSLGHRLFIENNTSKIDLLDAIINQPKSAIYINGKKKNYFEGVKGLLGNPLFLAVGEDFLTRLSKANFKPIYDAVRHYDGQYDRLLSYLEEGIKKRGDLIARSLSVRSR